MTEILVCNPEHYAIEYEINPWMSIQNQVDPQLAVKQWHDLVELLKHIGATVVEMTGEPGLPDMVFTANAGLVFDGKRVVIAKFKHPERQPESAFYQKWFESHGYTCVNPLTLDGHFDAIDCNFEGAGDALFLNQTNESSDRNQLFGNGINRLFLGYGFRSDRDAVSAPGWVYVWPSAIDVLELKDPYFYHLDTCFCPLKDNFALIWPGAFNDWTFDHLQSMLDLLCVPEEDARKFACNAVAVGNKVIIPAGCEATKELLVGAGFEVFDTDMSEFIKAGGACKCLTLRI